MVILEVFIGLICEGNKVFLMLTKKIEVTLFNVISSRWWSTAVERPVDSGFTGPLELFAPHYNPYELGFRPHMPM
jgi:hypothetical protein